MKYHQLRVAALFTALNRQSRAIDGIALHCWHLWATREDAYNSMEQFEAWNKDYEATHARRFPTVAPLKSAAPPLPYDALQAEYEADHVRSYRSTYFTRSNLL